MHVTLLALHAISHVFFLTFVTHLIPTKFVRTLAKLTSQNFANFKEILNYGFMVMVWLVSL